jgi:phosphoenolpyruvate---glycerone phosphotransferase subunit DhaL
MDMETLATAALTAWIVRAADVIEANKAWLTELDAPIGDSDHGVNMARGFNAVKAKFAGEPPADIGGALKTVGMTLVSTVGGASGPLYGTFFLQAAGRATGRPDLDLAGWTTCFEAGVNGVMARGKAAPGDKTMVDALVPALEALEARAGRPLAEALAASARAAEEAMIRTIPMVARKGRASYLGERSAGHQDPGATSSHLLLQALAETVA